MKIFGEVQGIGYRYFTREKAKEIGLKGHVKNINDGTVEVVAEGKEEDLKLLLESCKNGPNLARVKKIDEKWGDYSGEFQDFIVSY